MLKKERTSFDINWEDILLYDIDLDLQNNEDMDKVDFRKYIAF